MLKNERNRRVLVAALAFATEEGDDAAIRDRWARLCATLGEEPNCLQGYSADELDPDHPFNDDGRE